MKARKKILVLTSKGGTGLVEQLHALQAYLDDAYELEPIYMFSDGVMQLDYLQQVPFLYLRAIKLYNFCVRKGYNRLINMLFFLAQKFFLHRDRWIAQCIKQLLTERTPVMVISQIPFVTKQLLQACQKKGIPLLIAVPDVDARPFFYGIDCPVYEQLYVSIVHKDVCSTLAPNQLPNKQVFCVGPVLRPDFFTQKDSVLIKHEYHIPADKKVILVLMGGQGSAAMVAYAQALASLSLPVHIIFAIGKHEPLRMRIKSISFASHISRTILGYTPHIADLMAASDLVITKPGSTSLFESLMLKKPLLIDAVQTPLAWEQANIAFVQKHGYGVIIKNIDHVRSTIERLFEQPTYYASIQEAIDGFDKRNGGLSIRQIVDSVCTAQETGRPAQ